MKVKISKDTLNRAASSVLDSIYSDIDRVSDSNLDKFMNYFTNDVIRLQVRTHNDRKYLQYRKQDRDTLQKMIPISNYMFDKLIEKWFSEKYDTVLDGGVLLPKKY